MAGRSAGKLEDGPNTCVGEDERFPTRKEWACAKPGTVDSEVDGVVGAGLTLGGQWDLPPALSLSFLICEMGVCMSSPKVIRVKHFARCLLSDHRLLLQTCRMSVNLCASERQVPWACVSDGEVQSHTAVFSCAPQLLCWTQSCLLSRTLCYPPRVEVPTGRTGMAGNLEWLGRGFTLPA